MSRISPIGRVSNKTRNMKKYKKVNLFCSNIPFEALQVRNLPLWPFIPLRQRLPAFRAICTRLALTGPSKLSNSA